MKIALIVFGSLYLGTCLIVFLGEMALAQITLWSALGHALTWPYWVFHGW